VGLQLSRCLGLGHEDCSLMQGIYASYKVNHCVIIGCLKSIKYAVLIFLGVLVLSGGVCHLYLGVNQNNAGVVKCAGERGGGGKRMLHAPVG